MSYNNPPRKHVSRISTPVRLGVAAVAACFIAAPLLAAAPAPSTNLPTGFTNLVGIDARNINYSANSLSIITSAARSAADVTNFNIAVGYRVGITQPSASANVLFRVLSNDPSVIYGTLSSNGRVWLVNPAGIFVGPGGLIDVAGFVASTLNIRNEDFLAGRSLFIKHRAAGDVVNQGEIRTPAGGSVYLIGANVSNEGIIVTPGGETILAAGNTVSLIDSALPGVKVDVTGTAGNATNLGTITAEAGRIGIAGVIVRNSGTLNASSVVSEGGRVFLKASQDAYVDGNGRIVTTGTKGGSVEVLGNRVAVMDNAEIDASGVNGGGRILVGGDYQGKNPDIQNANITYFGPNASLTANATEVGDGGTVIVWADDTTRAYGSISARGGATGGNGGLVETSGKRYLDTPGIRVDVGAGNGAGGVWLLDPSAINIVASGTTTTTYGGGEFSYGGNVGTLVDADLNAALSGGNVIVRTDGVGGGNGNISADGVTVYGTGSLTLAAYGGGPATGNIDIYGGSTITLDGSFKALAGWNGATTYYGSDVISGKGNINISESDILVGPGDIDLHAGNNITLGITSASIRTLIQSDGKTTVRAKNLSLYGGTATSGPQGPYVMLRSNTEQDIEVENQILLQAGSANNTFYGGFGSMFYGGSVTIQSGGEQNIQATILKIAAGAQGHDNAAVVDAYGSQTITLGSYGGAAGNLIITGGGDNTETYGGMTSYGGLGSYNNFAELRQGDSYGSQVIILESAGTVQLKGGDGTGYGGYFNMNPASEGWSSNNYAAIHNQGNGSSNAGYGQVIDFQYGGTLTVTGGTAGNGNFASIGNQSDGMMVIGSSNAVDTATGLLYLPAITLTGGASGGMDLGSGGDNLSNSADIYSETLSLTPALTEISGFSITINGYGGATTIGGAGIGANKLLLRTPGDLTMTGGGSNLVTSFPIPGAATAAYIGSDDIGTTNITIEAGGNINLTAGNNYGGAVFIGTVDGGLSTTIDIGAYGGISIQALGNSSVVIGNVAETSLGGANVTLKSIGNLTAEGNANAQVWIGSLNGGNNPTNVTLGSMRDITLTHARVGSVNDANLGASIAVYGGFMEDGNSSTYGGSLSFTGTKFGSALGDTAIGFYAAYGSGAGAGNISFSNGGGAYGASLDIVADRTLTLDAQDKGVRLQTTTGAMSITANNFFAYGGDDFKLPGEVNFFGDPVPYNGSQILVQAGTAGQTINVAGTLLLKAGSVSNPYGGSSYYGGAVTVKSDGAQTISAGSMTLQAGATGHDNSVSVAAYGDQTINVYGGGLTLNGSGNTGSYNNYVGIFQDSSGGTQTINVFGGGSLTLKGGAGNGVGSNYYTWSCDDGGGGNLCQGLVSWNGARIRQGGTGAQTINFDNGGVLWLEGGSGGNLNRAMITTESSGAQFINGTAAITLKGGTSGGTYYGGADAYLDNGAFLFANNSAYSAGSQTIYGSSLTMDGGYGGTAGAYITSATQDITISGNAVLTGGSGAGYHNRALIYTEASNAQTISVGGDLTLDAGDTAAGHKNDAGIWAYGGTQTLTVGGTLAAYGGTAGYDNAAFVGVDTAATTNQTINAGSIYLMAGGGTGPNAGYNNSAKIYYSGTAAQNVNLTGTAATVVMIAGTGNGVYGGAPDSCLDVGGNTLAACANLSASNMASISARGANQTLDFVYGGGSLSLQGGSVGNNNQALVYLAGTGLQTISGAPDITLTAGSGGVYIRDIDYLLGSHARIISKGTQSISAGNLTMTGGTSGAAQAVITTPGVLVINATGSVTLNGGGSTTVKSFYGGVLENPSFSLPGATGAVIGSEDVITGTTALTINAGKGITASGNPGGVWLRGVPSANVALNAGWDAVSAAPSGYGGSINLTGTRIQTDAASGTIDIVAYESSAGAYGGVTIDTGTVVYGSSIGIVAGGSNTVYGSLISTGDIDLNAGYGGGSVSLQGGDLNLKPGSNLQAGTVVTMHAQTGTNTPYGGGSITQYGSLTSVGAISMYGDRNIALNGSVSSSSGNLYARAGYSSTRQFGGNIEVRGVLSGELGVDLIAEAGSASGANGNITQYGSSSITTANGDVGIIGGRDIKLSGIIDGGEGAVTVKAGFSATDNAATLYGGKIWLTATSRLTATTVFSGGDVSLYAEAGSGSDGSVIQDLGSIVTAYGGDLKIFGGGNVKLDGSASAYGGFGSVKAGYTSYGGGTATANGGNITVSGKLFADYYLDLLASAGSSSGLNGNITQNPGSVVSTNNYDITIVSAGDTTINGKLSAGERIYIGAGLDPFNTINLSGYGGNISFGSSSIVESRDGYDAEVISIVTGGGTRSQGNIVQTSGAQLTAGYGDINVLAYGDARMDGTTTITDSSGYSIYVAAGAQNASGLFSSFGGGIRAGSSNIVSINRLNAVYGGVEVQAAGAILRSTSNPNGPNIVADYVDLASVYGGASNQLAISAITKATGSIIANVNSGASYGGISIINLGDQPTTETTLTDNASSPGLNGGASISFYNAGNLALGGTTTFSSSNDGDIVIASGGSLDYTSGLASTAGGIILGAGSVLNMYGGLTTAGTLGLAAGSVLNIDNSVSGSNVTLVAPTVNIDSGVTATADAIVIGRTIDIYGGSVTGANILFRGAAFGTGNLKLSNGGYADASGQLEFNLANVDAYGGHLAATSSTSNITGFVSGNITLDNGAYFLAGDDIDLTLSGSTSTVSLSNGAHMVSDAASGTVFTTFLNFLARSGDGVKINGTTTTTSTPGGSGFFVLTHDTPATTTSGGGLVITYANAVIVDPCAASPDLCKPPSPIKPIIDVVEADPCATSPDSAQCKAIKTGEKEEEEDSFGDEATDGKKDEKSSQKKVAQCGV